MQRKSPRTLAVRGVLPREEGIVSPIHRSATYELGEPESFDDIRYIRLNNTPSQLEVEATLAALENAEASLVTPSGTAGIWLALLGTLSKGETVLVPRRLYGGTRKILKHLAEREGVVVREVDLDDSASWPTDAHAFFVETIANPWVSVPPLREVGAFCDKHGVVGIIDNTLATPVLCTPRLMGFSLIVHSASKALNGHADVVAGVIAGDAPRIRAIRKLANRLGVCPDPQACWLLSRGLQTLHLRVEAQCASALAIARAASEHVPTRYPGLETDPSHERARAYFGTRFGSVVTMDFESSARAKTFIQSLELAIEAPSLGGVQTLVTRPTTTSHAGLDDDEVRAMGVSPGWVRLAVGCETTEDLLADVSQAIHRAMPSLSGAASPKDDNSESART